MRTYKNSVICMGILSLLSIVAAFEIQFSFNQKGDLDFYTNILIGVFGSSLITLFYAVISYQVEYYRLMKEMSNSFTLSVLSLDQCCIYTEQVVVYKLNKFSEWKSCYKDFIQNKNNFDPIIKTDRWVRKVDELSSLLYSLRVELIKQDQALESTDVTDKETMRRIFTEISEINDKYKERVNSFQNFFEKEWLP